MKLLYGLIAGAAAALVASLVQLPLTSPDDALLNSGTVSAGALVAGLYLGFLWAVLSRAPNGLMMYAGAAAASFVAVAVLALISEAALLEGSVEFVVPLAAIVLGIAAPLVFLLSLTPLARTAQLGGAGVALALALAVGIGLSGRGDSESGRLELPGLEPSGTPVAAEALTPGDVAGVVYAVVSDESQLTYTVNEHLANLPTESDAVGSTGALTGEVRLDGLSQVQADLSTLESDQSRRDDFLRMTTFGSDPIATFVLDDVGPLPESYAPGETYTSTVTGTVTILGTETPITFEVEALLSGDELQIVGRTDITFDAYGIPKPSVPSVLSISDDIHIEVLLIARAATEA